MRDGAWVPTIFVMLKTVFGVVAAVALAACVAEDAGGTGAELECSESCKTLQWVCEGDESSADVVCWCVQPDWVDEILLCNPPPCDD